MKLSTLKGFVFFAVVAFSTALLARNGLADDFESIKAAAKKEGTLVFLVSAPRQQTTDALVELFNKRFDMNIKVERVALRSPDVPARLLTEKRAGRITADVSIVADLQMPLLTKNDLIEKVDWEGVFGGHLDKKELHIGASSLIDEQIGLGMEYRHLVYGVAYNTKQVAEKDLPKTWQDLGDPKWRRKIAIDADLSPLTRLLPVIGRDAMLALGKKILDNQPIFADGTTNAIAKVVSGEAALGVLAVNVAVGEASKGAPIDFTLPDPQGLVSQQIIFVIKGAPHPNLAKLWTAWLGSEAMATQPILDEGALRARAGAPGPFGDYYSKHNLTTPLARTVQELLDTTDASKDLIKLTREQRR